MSGRDARDVYRVDVATGKREKLLTKSPFGANAEPERPLRALSAGRAVVVGRSRPSGARANLTGKIKSVFVNMEDDHPVPERRAYGVAGFTTGEKSRRSYMTASISGR